MTTLTTTPVKTITYDRLTGDYKMELDGEFVGYAACYHLAEIELDRLAYERLNRAGVEPELTLSATALDGVCSCGTVFNEYGQCENCSEVNPPCTACHANTYAASTLQPAFCTECVYAMLQGRTSRLDTGEPGDEAPADDHNLVTPDPAECPSTTEPQPVDEDLPACGNCGQAHHIQRCDEIRAALLAEPEDAPTDDEEPADDEDGDDWPDGIDDVLASPWPASHAYFILPDAEAGETSAVILLCVNGVSREISADLVAGALALGSVHVQPRATPTIVLTSQSPIKLRALQAALDELHITANVVTVKASSGVNEQPLGDETRRGALFRIAAARGQVMGDLYVSIENGLFLEHGEYVDRALVVAEWSPNRPVITLSDGVIFPFDAVMEAQRRGFQATTVGQVLAERGIVKDHADPHVDLCGTSRETILRAAVRQALAQLFS